MKQLEHFGFTEEHFFDPRVPEAATAVEKGALQEHLEGFHELLNWVAEWRQKIARDSGLNLGGKRKKMAEIGKEAARKAWDLDGHGRLQKLREKAERTREKYLSPDTRLKISEDAEIDAHLEVVYRRDELKKLSEADRKAAYLQAIEEDDVLTLRAVEFAPKFAPVLPQDVVEEGREQHARLRWPEKMEYLDALETVVDRVEWNQKRAAEVLEQLTGDPRFKVFGPQAQPREDLATVWTAEELRGEKGEEGESGGSPTEGSGAPASAGAGD